MFIRTDIRSFLEDLGVEYYNNKVRIYLETLREVGFDLDLENGPWIAGGCLEAMSRNDGILERDIDYFTNSGRDPNTKFIEKTYKNEKGGYFFSNEFWPLEETERSEHRYVLINKDKVKLQRISFRKYTSPYKMLGDFDFSPCQIVTDGYEVLLPKTAYTDLKHRQLRINKLQRGGNSIHRFSKYTLTYGYKPVPGTIRRLYETTNGRESEYSRGNS